MAPVLALIGILSLTVPDNFAIPIFVLFLSGVVTFAAWLVKSNQASLQQSRDAAITAAAGQARLEELFNRVTDLEKWRLRRAEDNQYNQRDQQRARESDAAVNSGGTTP